MNDRPLGLISVDELVRVLPDLIADALRERDTRPPPASQATLTKATGVVTAAGTTTAEVQLDEDEPGVISQVQLASAVAAGDRVVVLLSPGGSAIAIGSGSAQAAAAASVAALPTDWVEWQVVSAQGPYLWNGPEQEVLWGDPADGMSHGSAIALVSGHAEAAADGWYSLSGNANAESLSATTGYNGLMSRLRVTRSFTLDGDGQEGIDNRQLYDVQTRAGADQRAYATLNWTGYLMAGDTVRFYLHMQADTDPGDDWQVEGGIFYMEKLPM